MHKSSRKKADEKSVKPRPDFPLFPHARGRSDWEMKSSGSDLSSSTPTILA